MSEPEHLSAREPAADDAERTREILLRRAERLARVPEDAGGSAERDTLVSFELVGQRFAVEAARVVEVTRAAEWTPFPGAAPPLLGVAGWRGGLLTLFRLDHLLDLPAAGEESRGWLLVLDAPATPVGVLVDRPGDFLEVGRDEYRPLPGGEADAALIRSLTSDGVAVLDVDSLLSLLS